MTHHWAPELLARAGAGKEDASHLALLAQNVVTTCRYAAHNDNTVERHEGEKMYAIANTLAVVEFILGMTLDAAERLEHEHGRK